MSNKPRPDGELDHMHTPDTNKLMKRYSYRVDNHRILSPKEENEYLAKAIIHNCNESREMLITHNRKFVMSTVDVLQKTHRTIPTSDLIGYGMLGLCQSIDKFDINRLGKVKFTTHAVWWIRQSIYKYAHECETMIRIPMNKVADIRAELRTERYKETKQLSNLHSILLSNANAMPSIDEPVTEGGDLNLGDVASFNSYDGSHQAEEGHHSNAVTTIMHQVIDDLPDRQKQVITLLYGLVSDQPMSMREVGAEIGLSHERVRTIRDNTFGKLRRKFKHLQED